MIVPGKLLSLSAKMSEELNIPFGIRASLSPAMQCLLKTRRMAVVHVWITETSSVRVAGKMTRPEPRLCWLPLLFTWDEIFMPLPCSRRALLISCLNAAIFSLDKWNVDHCWINWMKDWGSCLPLFLSPGQLFIIKGSFCELRVIFHNLVISLWTNAGG